MAFTAAQEQRARTLKEAAARDISSTVRLIAGPGTGKSAVIEQRVSWLLENGVPAREIRVVSFTRAAAADLRVRIQRYCNEHGQPIGSEVRVTTLHALALGALRAAGLLNIYTVDPLVMSSWEQEEIFDEEFSTSQGLKKSRCVEIRKEREAFWSTGQQNPQNYQVPTPPITDAEREAFEAFHNVRTQLYSCVLPGEIIRKCVERIEAGLLNPTSLLHVSHLIVDEFQDLNPMDLTFVDSFVRNGTVVFVAGDDDQSVYSFRYASPAGIQEFVTKYPNSGQHELPDCFRCATAVLAAGRALMRANADTSAIPKNIVSAYQNSEPPVSGFVHRWRFRSGRAESKAIARSCRTLIDAGVSPRHILILILNQQPLSTDLGKALEEEGILFESPKREGFQASKARQLVLALLRIVCNPDDYMALRIMLGLRTGVGITSCNSISETAISANLNFRAIFYEPLPNEVFSGRLLTALTRAREICGLLTGWNASDTLEQRLVEVEAIIRDNLGEEEVTLWNLMATSIQPAITFEELRDFLFAETDEQKSLVLNAVSLRLGVEDTSIQALPPRVRIMTMHGSKGLDARVVFIPGMEEEIIPGPRRQAFPGYVLEAARLLYVSITRARAACIISLAAGRYINGWFTRTTPSRFASQLNGSFMVGADAGLSQSETGQIITSCSEMGLT